MVKKFLLLTLLLFSISPVLAFDFPHTTVTISYDTNITNMSQLLDSDSGSAANGEILVWNSASGLWEPSAAGAGDITGITTSGEYLSGGTLSGQADLLFNETRLNQTINSIAGTGSDTNETTRVDTMTGTDCGAGNYSYGFDASGNIQCREDTTGSGDSKAGDGTYTYNDTDIIYFNATYADANLEVNGSDYWDGLNSANTTWFVNLAGILSPSLSQLTTWVDAWLGGKTTDDLTEGSSNLYDNQSWTEAVADAKYALIGAGADNSSWNSSVVLGWNYYNATDFDYNDYYLLSNPFGYYNSTTLPSTSDTNASTACSGDEVLLGNGSCYDMTGYFDNTDANLTEADVEGYIFDADNTGDLETSGNITGGYILGDGSYLTGIESATDTNCSVDGSCDAVAYDSEINVTYINEQDSLQDECSEISGCVVGAITDGNTGWDNSYNFITNDTMNKSVSWNDLVNVPAGFADGVDNQSAGGADWTELTSIPAGFDDDIDNDTTYTAGSNLSLVGTEFSLDVPSLKTYLDTLYAAIDSVFSGSWNDLTDVPAGFSDGIDNDTTYSALSEFSNDVNFITNGTMNKTVSCSDIIGGDDGDFCSDAGGTEYTHLSNFTNDQGFYNATTIPSYISTSAEGDLNVNSSDYWDGANTANTTWFNVMAGVFGVNTTGWSDWFDSLFFGKTTDDLTEGSTNFYDNRSWNESHANTQYYAINNPFSYYNETTFSESDPHWTANYSLYNTTWSAGISWSEATNGTLAEMADVLGFNYYNSTDFDYNDYYLLSNPFGYYNSTTIPTYLETESDPHWTANYTLYNDTWSSGISWAEAVNGTLAKMSEILAFSYYNATDFDIADYFTSAQISGFNYWNDTLNGMNVTYTNLKYANASHNHAASEITAGTFGTGNYVMDTNLTVERVVFENSASNYIEDNSTCIKVYGATSVMEIC